MLCGSQFIFHAAAVKSSIYARYREWSPCSLPTRAYKSIYTHATAMHLRALFPSHIAATECVCWRKKKVTEGFFCCGIVQVVNIWWPAEQRAQHCRVIMIRQREREMCAAVVMRLGQFIILCCQRRVELQSLVFPWTAAPQMNFLCLWWFAFAAAAPYAFAQNLCSERNEWSECICLNC